MYEKEPIAIKITKTVCEYILIKKFLAADTFILEHQKKEQTPEKANLAQGKEPLFCWVGIRVERYFVL